MSAPLFLLFFLSEQPLEHFGVAVGRIPGIVADVGILGELGFAAGFLQGFVHIARTAWLDRAVFGAMKDPLRYLGDLGCGCFVTTATDVSGFFSFLGIATLLMRLL